MLNISCILHPTDFSANSQAAFPIACALARDYGARLLVLHVFERPVISQGGVMTPPPPTTFPEEREAAQLQLMKVLAPKGDVRVEHRFEEGDPVTGILQVVKEIHSDVIVMGTHGRTGLARLLMGSVAEKVIRQATCAVLTVKNPTA